MGIGHRSFDDEQGDFPKVWAFVLDDYAAKREAFIWHVGRLGDWRCGLWNERKLFPSFKRKNAELWLDDFGGLVGLVISENCGSDFAVFARDGYESLYAGMLEWVKEHWSGRGPELVTEVHERQTEYVRALEEAGFGKRALVAVTRQYDLRDKAQEEIKTVPGFRIVDMATSPDYPSKAALYIDGFDGRDDPPSSFELLRFEYSRENPAYYPNLDFSVMTEDGLHVSTCVAFADYRNRVAEVEKICTRRDYRRQGLAEAVIRACFHRLRAQGIEYAYITGYSDAAKSLYAKVGGRSEKGWFSYAIATSGSR